VAPQRANLVVVAYPSEEVLGFSTVCRNAWIIAASDPKWLKDAKASRRELKNAAIQLRARDAINLNYSPERVSSDSFRALVEKLKEFKPAGRVYSHSPLDDDRLRSNVALAAALAFGKIWIPAPGGMARQVNVLARAAFQKKLHIINGVYFSRIRSEDDEFRMPHTALLGVEAFTPATLEEIIHGLALTRSEILPFDDAWGLFHSPYERSRYRRCCELLLKHAPAGSVRTILEVGACEGAMTLHLRKAFPEAHIRALEPHADFAARLHARFKGDKRIEIVQKSIADVPLAADIVLLAEILYYVKADLRPILRKIRTRHLLTSSEGDFDMKLSKMLSGFNWRMVAMETVASKFEALSRDSDLFCRREGTNIRLWRRGN
jgi:hypothetical protein